MVKKIIQILFIVFLTSCVKDVDIVLPDSERKLVVEGSIEQGSPPFVILTKTIGYFEPTDLFTSQGLQVHDATVTVTNGVNSVVLDEVCSNDLPDSLLKDVSQLTGVSVIALKNINFCLYTTFNSVIFGEVGKTYNLTIEVEGKTLTSSTQIPPLVPMDEYWYKDQPGFDYQGYIWFNLNDPPQLGNAYRIFTQRLGKDDRFIPVVGSVFEDRFFNGLDFDAFLTAGYQAENGETAWYFDQGDTVVIKFCSIDLAHFEFWDTYEVAAFNEGNPFAAPSTIKTNIEGGGLGVWGGYGASYDTLYTDDL